MVLSLVSPASQGARHGVRPRTAAVAPGFIGRTRFGTYSGQSNVGEGRGGLST